MNKNDFNDSWTESKCIELAHAIIHQSMIDYIDATCHLMLGPAYYSKKYWMLDNYDNNILRKRYKKNYYKKWQKELDEVVEFFYSDLFMIYTLQKGNPNKLLDKLDKDVIINANIKKENLLKKYGGMTDEQIKKYLYSEIH